MKILAISDTHEKHHDINGDLVDVITQSNVDMIIHAGDVSNPKNPEDNIDGVRNFLDWYGDLDVEKKVYVPGNHDTSMYHGLVLPSEYPDITFLINTKLVYKDVVFYGSSWTPLYGKELGWNLQRNDMQYVWSQIPKDTQVLITHGPPHGILDRTKVKETGNIANVGCEALRMAVGMIQPTVHIFGHIHDEDEIVNNGVLIQDSVTFINASMVNKKLNPVNKCIEVEI